MLHLDPEQVIAGKDEARYSLALVRQRTGSTQALPQFAQMVRQFVNDVQGSSLPEYDLALEEGKGGMVLLMRYRPDAAKRPLPDAPELPLT